MKRRRPCKWGQNDTGEEKSTRGTWVVPEDEEKTDEVEEGRAESKEASKKETDVRRTRWMIEIRVREDWGTWVSHSVKSLLLAHVMILGSWDRVPHRAP